jgi:hypothetical protein
VVDEEEDPKAKQLSKQKRIDLEGRIGLTESGRDFLRRVENIRKESTPVRDSEDKA